MLYVTAYTEIRRLAKNLHQSYVARADWLVSPLFMRLHSAQLGFAGSPFHEFREGWEVIMEDFCHNFGLEFLCEFMVKLKVHFPFFKINFFLNLYFRFLFVTS